MCPCACTWAYVRVHAFMECAASTTFLRPKCSCFWLRKESSYFSHNLSIYMEMLFPFVPCPRNPLLSPLRSPLSWIEIFLRVVETVSLAIKLLRLHLWADKCAPYTLTHSTDAVYYMRRICMWLHTTKVQYLFHALSTHKCIHTAAILSNFHIRLFIPPCRCAYPPSHMCGVCKSRWQNGTFEHLGISRGRKFINILLIFGRLHFYAIFK